MTIQKAIDKVIEQLGGESRGWDRVGENVKESVRGWQKHFPGEKTWTATVRPGKAANARWIVCSPIGNVIEIGVKRGVAKVLAYYNDLDDANAEGFTAADIENHVNVDA